MGGTRLRLELDRIPLWRGDHVGIKQLADDFAKYVYLPRLKDSNVLTAAIRDGLGLLMWETETFAYAESWDEQQKKYRGLQTGMNVNVVVDSNSVIVKPDVAKRQLEEDTARARKTPETPSIGVQQPLGGFGGGTETGGPAPATPATKPKRFHATKSLDPMRLSRDAQQIAEEIVQQLTRLDGAEVDVQIELQVKIPNGAPDNIVRTVTENCRTLKFENYEFESE